MAADLVECRSDHAYPGRPLAFLWHGQRLEVNEIVSEERTPQGITFRVRNQNYGVFKLSYDTVTDQWSVHQSYHEE
jgi:hypothetical protein